MVIADLTDVTPVSEDAFERFDWCDSGQWGCLIRLDWYDSGEWRYLLDIEEDENCLLMRNVYWWLLSIGVVY